MKTINCSNLVPQRLTLNVGGRILDLTKPVVMGILNRTPDSFSDGGQFMNDDVALAHVESMLMAGATIIDVGGCSTRPGSTPPTVEEEITRVAGIIRKISSRWPEVIISIDTYRSQVVKAAFLEGATLVNDISGGTIDQTILQTVADCRCPYVLTHIQGTPENMQQNPVYNNINAEIWEYFTHRVTVALSLGINDIIIDPGFGFGKTIDQNYDVFKHLENYTLLGMPMMIGISRKSMLYKFTGGTAEQTIPIATALHLKALEKGVKIIRVHDVEPAMTAIKLFEKLNS